MNKGFFQKSAYLNAMLQAEKLPASVADLDSCLTDVDR